MPACPALGSVFTTVVRKSARAPFVMYSFATVDAPRRRRRASRACVMPATSEPASGSVIAIAAIFVPAIAGRRYRSRLLVGAELGERGRGHVGLHRHRHRDRAAAGLRELLDEHDLGREVAAAPAPALGVVEPEEPELAGPTEDVVGERARVFPLVDVRRELGSRPSGPRRPGARRARA